MKTGSRKDKHSANAQLMRYFSCGQTRHNSSECMRGRRPEERGAGKRSEVSSAEKGPHPGLRSERWREPSCYECGKLGHMSIRCPSRALYGEGRRSFDAEATSEVNDGLYRSGTVDGKPVKDILLDTGCTRTLVHQELIPREKKTSGEVIIRCAHDTDHASPNSEEC